MSIYDNPFMQNLPKMTVGPVAMADLLMKKEQQSTEDIATRNRSLTWGAMMLGAMLMAKDNPAMAQVATKAAEDVGALNQGVAMTKAAASQAGSESVPSAPTPNPGNGTSSGKAQPESELRKPVDPYSFMELFRNGG